MPQSYNIFFNSANLFPILQGNRIKRGEEKPVFVVKSVGNDNNGLTIVRKQA